MSFPALIEENPFHTHPEADTLYKTYLQNGYLSFNFHSDHNSPTTVSRPACTHFTFSNCLVSSDKSQDTNIARKGRLQ